MYSLFAMLLFGVTNFLLKYAGYKKMNSIFASMVLWVSVGVVGVIAIFLSHSFFKEELSSVSSKYYLLLPIFAGLFLAVGMYFLKRAVTEGVAGPAVAIAMTNSILVALLSYLLIGEKMSVKQIIGFVLILLGTLIFVI